MTGVPRTSPLDVSPDAVAARSRSTNDCWPMPELPSDPTAAAGSSPPGPSTRPRSATRTPHTRGVSHPTGWTLRPVRPGSEWHPLTAPGNIGTPGVWATRTLTTDGTWTEVDTNTPDLSFVFGDLSAGTEAVYAPAVDRMVVLTDGVLAEYDPVTRRWTHAFAAPLSPDDVTTGELARLSPTLVYDSVHDRVLVYGGHARLSTGWANLDDLWAYDPATGEWTVVLEATRQVLAE